MRKSVNLNFLKETEHKNFYAVSSIIIFLFIGYGITNLCYFLFTDILTFIMKFIGGYTSQHIFYESANYSFFFVLGFSFVQIVYYKYYKFADFHKGLFLFGSFMYLIINLNFMLVFLFYCFSSSIPTWLFV